MDLRRFSFRLGLAALLGLAISELAGPALSQNPDPRERPNLIFLLTDDQRWDALGCMGNTIVQTPHLDRLAAEGVLFRNNFCTTSICAVSRASFFTGQYARRHGIEDFAKPLSTEAFARTYPALLRKAGYRTGFIGKWGLGDPLPAQEFDTFTGYSGQGRYYGEGDKETVHLTRRMGDQALEFLRGSKSDQPFCLSISFKAPHMNDGGPIYFHYDPVDEPLYQKVTIPPPPTSSPAQFEAFPEFIRKSEGRARWQRLFSTPELYQQSVKGYYRLISGVDRIVGEIRAELEKMEIADRTAIIFTSDNGYFLGDRGLEGKWLMYEASIRIPLIVYLPDLPRSERGRRRDEMTLNIDVAPTLLDLAGVSIPDAMQGRSLQPLVRGESVRRRDDFFYEHHFDYGGKIPSSEGVRSTDWKYLRYLGTQPAREELYYLPEDPLEERNLAERTEPRFQERLRALRAKWEELRSSLR